jgi:hypothetical protein
MTCAQVDPDRTSRCFSLGAKIKNYDEAVLPEKLVLLREMESSGPWTRNNPIQDSNVRFDPLATARCPPSKKPLWLLGGLPIAR